MHLFKTIRDVTVVKGTEGRNPFEVFMLLWCVLAGAAFLFGAPEPGSIQLLLPSWLVTTWYISLCVGGLVGLVGVWWGDVITSLLVERAAMLFIVPPGVIYSLALFLSSGPRAVAAGGFIAAFSLAGMGRWVRITSQLHALRSVGRT